MSVDCRMLIIFLLSNKREWRINMTQLIDHFSPWMGSRKIYAVMKEAIEAGYVKREIIRDAHKRNFKKFKYLIFSRPQLKECLPFGNSAQMQNCHTKEYYLNSSSSSSLRSEEKEVLSEVPETASIPPPVRADARRLSFLFLEKLKEESPKLKEPNMTKWEYEFDLMIRRDKRTVEEIEELIRWWRDSWWYSHGARSPAKFRDKFDTMQVQMREKKVDESTRVNKEFCLNKSPHHREMAGMVLFDDNVVNKHTQKDLNLKMDPEQFKIRLYDLFGLIYDPIRH